MKRHGAVKTFLCLECNNSFYAKNELKRHQLRHQGVRPHKCTLCEAAFYTNTALKRHSRSHTQERPYKCKLCDKDYVNSGSLKEHQRTHTGKIVCYCEKSILLIVFSFLKAKDRMFVKYVTKHSSHPQLEKITIKPIIVEKNRVKKFH